MPIHSFFVPHGAPTFALRPGAAGAAPGCSGQCLAATASDHHCQRALGYGSANGRLFRSSGAIHDFWGLPRGTLRPALPDRLPRAPKRLHRRLKRPDGGRTRRNARPRSRRLVAAAPDVPRRAGDPMTTAGQSRPTSSAGRWRRWPTRSFLTIASGNLTHNLRDYQRATLDGGRTSLCAPICRLAGRAPGCRPAGAARLPPTCPWRGAGALPERGTSTALVCRTRAGGENAQARRLHAGIDDYVAWTPTPFSNPKGLLA